MSRIETERVIDYGMGGHLMPSNPIVDAAILYRETGIVTHPLSSPTAGGPSPGKRPLKPGWQKLTEPMIDAEIKDYLIERDCNLGAVCGLASNLMVIDIDWYVKGIWDTILSGIDKSNFVQQSRTSGRWHEFFKFNPKFKLKHCKPLGFDMLSKGGNVVLAPSVHVSGEQYVMEGNIANRPEIPELVIERLNQILATFNKLKLTLNKCRPTFSGFFNAVFIDDKHPQYHDLKVFRGMESRQRMLHLMAELKVNGATHEEMLLVCMLAFEEDYNENQSLTELSHIKPTPATTEAIKADSVLAQFHKDGEKPTTLPPNSSCETNTMSLEDIRAKGTKSRSRKLEINLPDDHFISKYCRYMSGITDAYEDYNIMCAMWLLSAACRKKVSLKLKQGVIYPNLYIMLFGLSTISRKSTSINKAKSFWELITEEKLFNDDYSLEGYLNLLQSKPISNFVRDEVVGLLQKYNKSYNDGIYELENSIYDCQSVRKTLASSSRKSKDDDKKDDDVVKDPYVTRLSGTTGHNYSSCMTVANFRTGYGFRHLYCHPQYKKDRMPLALEEIIDVKAHADVSKAYRHIYEIIGNIRKEIGVKVNPDAMEYLDKVDKEMQEKIIKLNEDDMASAWGRNVDHILKLCMLIEIGKAPNPNFTITLDTMKEACRIVKEYFFPTCIETLEQLQEDEQRNKVEKVVNVLRRKGGTCQHSMLLKSSKLLSDDFNRVISTLKESGVIEEYTEKKTGAKYYVLKKDSSIEKL